MWLIRIDHRVRGDPTKDKLYFECKACDACAVVPPLD
jgi:hypothetical protein